MIKVITEGETIPSGFWIKIGFFSKKAFESFKCMDIKGEDGLVEARHIYPVFRSSEETRPWATLGFQLGKFRISYRIRNWSTNIFKIS